MIKKNYGVDFKEDNIQSHFFFRSTNSRDSLSTIIVTPLPGYFSVELHTSRVGYGLDDLVTTKKFVSSIAAECD